MGDQLQKQGAEIVALPLKVELDPEAEDVRGPGTGAYINGAFRGEN